MRPAARRIPSAGLWAESGRDGNLSNGPLPAEDRPGGARAGGRLASPMGGPFCGMRPVPPAPSPHRIVTARFPLSREPTSSETKSAECKGLKKKASSSFFFPFGVFISPVAQERCVHLPDQRKQRWDRMGVFPLGKRVIAWFPLLPSESRPVAGFSLGAPRRPRAAFSQEKMYVTSTAEPGVALTAWGLGVFMFSFA